MKIAYVKRRFHPPSLAIIAAANGIIESYQKQGYTMTLRQIYYRFIAADLFPRSWVDDEYNKKFGHAPGTKNTMKNYKRLGELLNDARLAGLVDWDAMEDRTRNLMGASHFADPQHAVEAAARQYLTDKWEGQPRRVEVWIEKDALLGVFERACLNRDIDVPYFSCRGYNSQSEMWGAAQRILWYKERYGQDTTILQFSDHDPSGIDMERDIRERLEMFLCPVTVRRMALTIAQVRKFNPPPNPARETDARYADYKRKFGDDSWELDALDPVTLDKLIRDAVLKDYRDHGAWAKALKAEARDKTLLAKVAKRWDKVKRAVR